jgi:acetyl esterase
VGHPRHVKAHQAKLASPLRVLEAPEPEGARPLPPFFIAVGTKDPLLPDSRRLADALRLKGVDVRYEVYPGELHAFDVMLHRRQAQAKWAACFEFLEAHLAPPAERKARPAEAWIRP